MSTVLKKGAPSRSYPSRQRKLGPAPFASFEDLSDELESPADGQQGTDFSKVEVLPEIKEDTPQSPHPLESPDSDHEVPHHSHKPVTATSSASTVTFAPSYSAPTSGPTSGLQTPSTPRIDISCASSSTPPSEDSEGSEKELFQGGLGYAFHEEGTEELRSSTEELDLGEAEVDSEEERRQKRKEKEEKLEEIYRRSSHPANIFCFGRRKSSNAMGSGGGMDDDDHPNRKPSAHTLFLDGLLSRPAARHHSFGSGEYNRPGAISSMSAHSSGSMRGRSPSPHKMMLETSFCGSKPIPTKSMEMDSPPKEEGLTTTTDVLKTPASTRKSRADKFAIRLPSSPKRAIAATANSNINTNAVASPSPSNSNTKFAISAPSSPRTPPKSPRSPIKDFERRPSSGRRSVSPFKMVYETSFCGNKPIPTKSMEQDSPPKDIDFSLGTFLQLANNKAKTPTTTTLTSTTVQVHQLQNETPSPTNSHSHSHRGVSPDSPKSSDHWRPLSPLPSRDKGTPSPSPIQHSSSLQENSESSTSQSTARFVNSPSPQDGRNLKLQTTNIFKWPETEGDSDKFGHFEKAKLEKSRSKDKEKGDSSSCSSKKAKDKKSKDSKGSSKAPPLESEERTTELKISEDPVVTDDCGHPQESKGLFMPSSDSYEHMDEDGDLPYVPTTLPLEKPSVVPIFPSKERRSQSVTTMPLQRPKVNRPPNPASLNDYIASSSQVPRVVDDDKMKINLPREDSLSEPCAAGYTSVGGASGGVVSSSLTREGGSVRSPKKGRGSIGATSWTDFAEAGLRSPRDIRRRLREENGDVDDVSWTSDSPEVGQVSWRRVNVSDDEEMRF